jgi:hypothetical protein
MTAAARRWTPSEILLFEKRRAEKVDLNTIAVELGRSLGSVTMRGQISNVRKCQRRLRELDAGRVAAEAQYVVPPSYVMRERQIRLSIPSTSSTQVFFADPVDGYSALASKRRKISVQDALEICALYNGSRGEIVALAATYGITSKTIRSILNGEFFERLLKQIERPED